MRKIGLSQASALLMAILLMYCKKSSEHLNITLHDKPLSVIQSYIQGQWELRYMKGGIATQTIQQTNYFWQFGSKDRLTETDQGTITADTTITWKRDLGLFIGTDSTYLMNFFDKQGVPWVYVVDGIYNDTLLLHDNAVDGYFYHFTKSN
jgi:hypothetical protein